MASLDIHLEAPKSLLPAMQIRGLLGGVRSGPIPRAMQTFDPSLEVKTIAALLLTIRMKVVFSLLAVRRKKLYGRQAE
jgi:hypothetical protein